MLHSIDDGLKHDNVGTFPSRPCATLISTTFFFITFMTTESRPGFAGSLLQIMAPELPLILFLIFGGCCSNVFALEVIVKYE